MTTVRAKSPRYVSGRPFGDWQVTVKLAGETVTLSLPAARSLRDDLSEAIADAESHDFRGDTTLDVNHRHLLRDSVATLGQVSIVSQLGPGFSPIHVDRLIRGVGLDRYYVNRAREFIQGRLVVETVIEKEIK